MEDLTWKSNQYVNVSHWCLLIYIHCTHQRIVDDIFFLLFYLKKTVPLSFQMSKDKRKRGFPPPTYRLKQALETRPAFAEERLGPKGGTWTSFGVGAPVDQRPR